MKIVALQALRFVGVGLINTTIGMLAIFGIIYFFQAGPLLANLLGYAIGFSFSFLLHRAWTFSDNRSPRKTLPTYFVIAAAAFLVNLITVHLLSTRTALGPYSVQVFGVLFYTTIMFFGCKLFVFKANIEASPPHKNSRTL